MLRPGTASDPKLTMRYAMHTSQQPRDGLTRRWTRVRYIATTPLSRVQHPPERMEIEMARKRFRYRLRFLSDVGCSDANLRALRMNVMRIQTGKWFFLTEAAFPGLDPAVEAARSPSASSENLTEFHP